MTFHTTVEPSESARNIRVAALIVGSWAAVRIHALWLLDVRDSPFADVAVLLGLVWLSTGLLIVTRDAMHSAVMPESRPGNSNIGRLAVALCAGFSWRKAVVQILAHHRHAGDSAQGGRSSWYFFFLRARMSSPLPLLPRFHFGGFHHEHNLQPQDSWWRLPEVRWRLPEFRSAAQ